MGINDYVRSVNSQYDQFGDLSSYRHIRLIGKGGQANVYEVEKRGRTYAMKVPNSVNLINSDETICFPRDNDFNRDYMREAQNWADLTASVPDAVVNLIDYNIEPFPWMVMEYADRDFRSAMEDGSVGIDDFICLLGSLSEIHDQGIIHLDIKPENILQVNGRWKFSDFGLSKVIGRNTQSLETKGTLDYMAPEQITRKTKKDATTDIWQMGILLYRMVTGHSPYDAKDPNGIMMELLYDGPNLDVVPGMYQLILSKALAKEQKDRFQTANEFRGSFLSIDEDFHPDLKDPLFDEYFHPDLKKSSSLVDNPPIDPFFMTPAEMCREGDRYCNGSGVETNWDKAAEWYRKAAELGYAEAQYKLGFYYDLGVDDLEKALEWFTKAAEQGYAEAQCQLALFYKNKRDDVKALEWYRKAAEQGYAIAQCELALCYMNGNGVKRDDVKALEWFTKAAEQGYAEAQYNLGWCYHNGIGTVEDFRKSYDWYTKAAEQGYAEAQYELGLSCKKNNTDPVMAAEWFTKAAEQGHAEAQYELALCYLNLHSAAYDGKKAVEWFTKAAEQGHKEAQWKLGECYAHGHIIPRDLKKAAEWYAKAVEQITRDAERGDAEAQYILGKCYATGKGVDENYEMAVYWYTKAGEQDHDEAQLELGVCYDHGRGVPLDHSKAMEWIEKSAKNGNATAKVRFKLRKVFKKIV